MIRWGAAQSVRPPLLFNLAICLQGHYKCKALAIGFRCSQFGAAPLSGSPALHDDCENVILAVTPHIFVLDQMSRGDVANKFYQDNNGWNNHSAFAPFQWHGDTYVMVSVWISDPNVENWGIPLRSRICWKWTNKNAFTARRRDLRSLKIGDDIRFI